jgi:hypothetical protein
MPFMLRPNATMRKHTFFDFRACIQQCAEVVKYATRRLLPACSGRWRTNREVQQPVLQPVQLVDDLREPWRGLPVPRLLGLFGGAVLAAGARAPLIHIPIAGTISYLHHPSHFTSCNIGELVILTAGGLSVVFALLKRLKPLGLMGIVALAQLIATLATFQRSVAAVVAKADQPDLVDPMLMWAGAALQRARFEWGIAVIGCGAMMLLAAAAWEFNAASRPEIDQGRAPVADHCALSSNHISRLGWSRRSWRGRV